MSAPAGAVDAPPRRRRPKDRRQQIAMAAAVAFSARGYHQVSMGDVAAEVGITAAALYRHFPNKYALFVDASRRLAHGLIEATDPVIARDAERDPAAQRDDILRAVIDVTIENRLTGGLYRWEGRYLTRDDRALLRHEFDELVSRVRRPLVALRPDLSDADADVLSAAALSVIASITAHHTTLRAKALTSLLLDAADSVLAVDLPPAADRADAPAPTTGVPSASTRERLVNEAIPLFYRLGYHETTVEDICSAVGITASALYRHFPGKSDILLEACVRATERLGATTSSALGSASSREQALGGLVDAYIDYAFTQHELMSVYFSDVGALPEDDRVRLYAIQRRHVDEWVSLLESVRPELTASAARFLVHAGLNVTVDVVRVMRFADSPAARVRVATLVRATLGVD